MGQGRSGWGITPDAAVDAGALPLWWRWPDPRSATGGWLSQSAHCRPYPTRMASSGRRGGGGGGPLLTACTPRTARRVLASGDGECEKPFRPERGGRTRRSPRGRRRALRGALPEPALRGLVPQGAGGGGVGRPGWSCCGAPDVAQLRPALGLADPAEFGGGQLANNGPHSSTRPDYRPGDPEVFADLLQRPLQRRRGPRQGHPASLRRAWVDVEVSTCGPCPRSAGDHGHRRGPAGTADKPALAVGGLGGHPERPIDRAPHPPDRS